MKNIVSQISLTLFVVMFASCFTNKTYPVIFTQDKRKSIGVISFDQKHTIQFQLQNSGTGELFIDTVTSSCECTVISLSKKNIKPKEKFNISVEFDPVDTGYFDKKIVIRSNIDSFFTILSFNGYARVVDSSKNNSAVIPSANNLP